MKLREKILNESKNEEKHINNRIFKEYFYYQDPSSLTKDLYEDNQIKNDRILSHLNESLIDFKKSVNGKEIPKNGNPNKIIDIVQKILDFNKQQKGRGCPLELAIHLKILTPKQIIQRLPIALAQVKACTTSENLLNEIRLIIYFFYQAKKLL